MSATSPVQRQEFDRYFIPMFNPAPFIPVRGEGARLWDQAGREYIDFAGGIAVNALGHAHPALCQVLTEQAQQLWHLGNGYTNEPVIRLARHLVNATFADQVFFCNSGAEANEAALKLARKYGRDTHGEHKTQIVAFGNAFHGRTLFTVSAGGQPKYAQDFAPLPGGIQHAPYNDLAAAAALINEHTCAVIVEPIQGEGGVLPADPAFLQGLRALCDRHQALLIFDEVQTGVGRTGELYAYMGYGVTPDLLTSAKALGGGFPIAALLAKAEYAKALGVGSHGTTYGGNPLACAVAGKVLEIIDQPALLAGVKERHQWFLAGLEEIQQRFPIFEQIRGRGLLIGCALAPRFAGQAKALTNLAAEEGLLALIAGPNVLRFAPALIIEQAEVEEGLARLSRAVARLVKDAAQ